MLARWLLVFAVASVGSAVTYVRCPGCLPRDRFNKACEWTSDTAFQLDARNPAHHAHLVEDAQLAEELAIRYADAEFGRRFGVEHHGGLIENGRLRRECLSRMFNAIETSHAVTSAQLQLARGSRTPTFDLAVALLFLPFYALGATIACRWIARRFSSTERAARGVATGLASAAVTLLGLQCFQLWGAVWEVIRVGNGHMATIREASQTRWVQQFVGADFIAGLVLFWFVALICYGVGPEDERPAAVRGPGSILLR